jgi:endonuclease-3 related protein
MDIKTSYKKLYNLYGPQGWWPLLDVKGTNPTKTGGVKGYHPGDYIYPKNESQKFEICVGAILTQNTAWTNVEKALLNLKMCKALSANTIISLQDEELGELIRPAGYYNQKARRLKIFAEFYAKLKGSPDREQLLALWGIGKETADSILLYAYKEPIFVVDTYTRRVFNYDKSADYDEIRKSFEQSLTRDYRIYQEYHALIVEHAKHHS